MKKYVPLIGKLGVAFGLVTAVCSFLPGWGVLIALISMIPGFISSTVYILLSTRYEFEHGRFNPGYIGMILNSTPVLLFIYFQLIA